MSKKKGVRGGTDLGKGVGGKQSFLIGSCGSLHMMYCVCLGGMVGVSESGVRRGFGGSVQAT